MSEIKYLPCEKCSVMPDAPTAMRLRRICNALELMSAVPDDDLELYRSMFSVLGIVARHIDANKQTLQAYRDDNAKLIEQNALLVEALKECLPLVKCYWYSDKKEFIKYIEALLTKLGEE